MSAFLGFIVLTIGLSLSFGFILDIDVLFILDIILCLVIIELGCCLIGGGL